ARRPPALPALGKRAAVTLDPGLELNPAISPDGKLVAYGRVTPTESRLVVQQLAGGEPVTVARWPGSWAAVSAWSPDGARLLLSSPRGLEVVPALGGVSRVLTSQTPDLRLAWGTWSPDGNRIAYSSADTLYSRGLDDDPPKVLARRPQAHSPAWSPDGRWIAFVSGNVQYPTIANLAPSSIWVVSSQGGEPIRITEDRPLHASPVWLPDSRGLLYVSDEDGGRDIYVARLSRSATPEGPAVRLTTGLRPHTISLSNDGKRLLYSLYTETSNVWAVDLQPGRSVSLHDARPVTTGSQVIEGFSVSPDGRWLAFDSNRNGKQGIWRMPLDGSTPPTPMSSGPEDEFQPSYSPDGKFVAFHAVRSGGVRDVYLVPAEGGTRTRVPLATTNNLVPRFSPDGRSLLYTIWGDDGSFSVRAVRRSADGSGWERASQLFKVPSFTTGGGDWSPDGKRVTFIQGTQVFRIEIGSDHPPELVVSMPAGFTPFYTRASPDGRNVYISGVRADGTYLIYVCPADGGAPREVAHSEGPTYQNLRFPFNLHGNRLFVSLADPQSDIWMAEMTRP
ncbi:MAG: hypothetical protein ACREOQ_05395, partial [Gemmatimonadales bacterium]